MKINNKVLSIPPYISTSWDRILSLHMQGNALVVALCHGETISIPGVSSETIESIFAIHAAYLEEEKPKPQNMAAHVAGLPPFLQASMFASDQVAESSIRFGLASLDGLTSVMQHDPSQANAPDLPHEIIEKISAVAHIVAPDEMVAMLPAKSDCNCPHCQITRAITGQAKQAELQEEEEPVMPCDLHFQEWEIVETSPNLYMVTNKLDTTERYNVFLGNPVGCTCGKEGCEHILAVLKS